MNRNKLSKWFDSSFYIIGFASTLIGLAILAVLIIDILLDGAGRLGWQFFTSYPSRKPEAAGILSAWIGTVWIMGLTGGVWQKELADKPDRDKYCKFSRRTIHYLRVAGTWSFCTRYVS